MIRRFLSVFLGWIFPPLRQNRAGLNDQDIHFMSEVDEAIHNTGNAFAYLLSLTILLCFALLLYWSAKASLDEVTRGLGKFIPSQRVQVIQNLEGGILEEVLVMENQMVEKGDVLLRINNSMATSQYQDILGKSLEFRAAMLRLEAESRGATPDFSRQKDLPKAVVRMQKNFYQARASQLRAELDILGSQLEQKQQEVAEMEGRLRQQEKGLELARRQFDIATPLRAQGLYAETDYLGLERDLLSIQGDIESLRIGIPRTRNAEEEIRGRASQRRAQFRAEALDELSRLGIELKSMEETLSAGKDRVTRTDVRSPVHGTIKQIKINTIGGVVRPGESIMEVVPQDETLLLEAHVRPADIAFLHPGQEAIIKVTAYDFAIYGGLKARVEQISVDTIQNEEGESFYLVKLRTAEQTLLHRGASLPIIPGMTATVEILTGRKTVLDYLLKPILKAKQSALRER